MPKIKKQPIFGFIIPVGFIIPSPKCYIKTLARTQTSIFRLFLERYNHVLLNVGILQVLKLFQVVQKNERVLDGINKLYKRRRAISVSTFDFFTLCTKCTHNEIAT